LINLAVALDLNDNPTTVLSDLQKLLVTDELYSNDMKMKAFIQNLSQQHYFPHSSSLTPAKSYH
jgi:hypothetical protein